MTSIMAGVNAFREQYVTNSILESDEFNDYDARRLRYEIYRASYENTTYRNIHAWAQGLRNRYGLNKYIRDIYNPTYRLVEYYRSMVWRGNLSPNLMGGAIPLITSGKTDDEAVRRAVVKLFNDSNFEVQKNIIVIKGANLGDVGILVRDDIQRGQVRLEVVDPANIENVVLQNGIVKEVKLTYHRDNEYDMMTRYTMTIERGNGDEVVYRTYVNNSMDIWPGYTLSEWREVYGFIPFVAIQHNNVGGTWGWAETHPLRSLIMETDDLASGLHDYIRKTENAPGLISGMSKPKNNPAMETAAATADRPMPGREELPMLWTGDGKTATWTPMIAPLDIANVYASIDALLKEMERDYPELKVDIATAAGDASGRALRVARQGAEAKVLERRTNYDSGLTRAIQMAVAIGGMRGYPDYAGFDLSSYADGKLDIGIAKRPVYPEDPAEKAAELQVMWQTVATAAGAGVPVEAVLRSYGWTDEMILAYDEMVQKTYIPAEGL